MPPETNKRPYGPNHEDIANGGVVHAQAEIAVSATVFIPYAGTGDLDTRYEPGVPSIARQNLIA